MSGFMFGGHLRAAHESAMREAEARQANERASAATSEVRLLRNEIERLLMISEALWMMLKEQHNYTDEDLIARIEAIDLRDGKLDGRVADSGPLRCPSCDRTLQGRHARCLYCGTEIIRDPFER